MPDEAQTAEQQQTQAEKPKAENFISQAWFLALTPALGYLAVFFHEYIELLISKDLAVTSCGLVWARLVDAIRPLFKFLR
jgi:hypothetical protein